MKQFRRLSMYASALLLAGITTLSNPSNAHAQERPFGLGLILGDPTGFSAKYWVSQRNAWDFGLAWSLDGGETLHLHADYLWHDFDLIDEPRTPVYFGVGGRLAQADDPVLSVRVPFGITHLVQDIPIDVFFELVPMFNLVPSTRLDLQGGIGARYYFRQDRRR